MDQPEFIAAHPSHKLRYTIMSDQLLLVEESRGNARPLVPAALVSEVVARFHRAAHAGVKATCRAVEAWYVVPGVAGTCKRQVGLCDHCQRGKPSRAEKPAVKCFEPPVGKFLDLHVDFVVLPPAKGKRYLLTVIDRATQWPEAFPLATSNTEETVDAFVHGLVAPFGILRSIVSDQGPQFVSALWRGVCRGPGVDHHLALAYHPATNGLIERWHRDLKRALAARLVGRTWVDALPAALLQLRTAVREDTGASAAHVVFGTDLRITSALVEDPPAGAPA